MNVGRRSRRGIGLEFGEQRREGEDSASSRVSSPGVLGAWAKTQSKNWPRSTGRPDWKGRFTVGVKWEVRLNRESGAAEGGQGCGRGFRLPVTLCREPSQVSEFADSYDRSRPWNQSHSELSININSSASCLLCAWMPCCLSPALFSMPLGSL